MTMWWWVCHHPGCLDMMARTTDPATAARDRDAHMASRHPGWTPTERELALQHWPQ